MVGAGAAAGRTMPGTAVLPTPLPAGPVQVARWPGASPLGGGRGRGATHVRQLRLSVSPSGQVQGSSCLVKRSQVAAIAAASRTP